MFRAGPLIATVVQPASMQAVVLRVVNDFQQRKREEALRQEEKGAHPAPGDPEPQSKQYRQAIPPEQFIVRVQEPLTLAIELLFL